jgi:PBP1b-binding outer membrane lipoprotein LpoB
MLSEKLTLTPSGKMKRASTSNLAERLEEDRRKNSGGSLSKNSALKICLMAQKTNLIYKVT